MLPSFGSVGLGSKYDTKLATQLVLLPIFSHTYDIYLFFHRLRRSAAKIRHTLLGSRDQLFYVSNDQNLAEPRQNCPTVI